MKTAIFFRGRNTAAIIADARLAGLIGLGDKIIVVCRPGDALTEPGDAEPGDLDICGDVVLICNGGTTAQQVPTIVTVVRFADSYLMYDVQRDGAVLLAATQYPVDKHGYCEGCGIKCQATEADESWDYCQCPRP